MNNDDTAEKPGSAPFSPEITRGLCCDFRLTPLLSPLFQFLFNKAAIDYATAKHKSENCSRATARKEIRKLHKSLENLQKQVSDLSHDSTHYLEKRSYVAAKKAENFIFSKPDKKAPLNKLSAIIREQQASIEIVLADLDDLGRPKEEDLACVMIAAHQMWVTAARRDFTLDWTENGEPLTDAAEWVVRIARTVDPNLPLGKIRTAAHKVRDRSIKINSLRKVFEFPITYIKRSR